MFMGLPYAMLRGAPKDVCTKHALYNTNVENERPTSVMIKKLSLLA